MIDHSGGWNPLVALGWGMVMVMIWENCERG